MSTTDDKGLPLSTGSAEARAAYERGIDLFLRWRGGAMDALDAATQSDPRFALPLCARAQIAWRMGRVDLATAAAQRAVALGDEALHEREVRHVEAVDAMQHGDHTAAHGILDDVAARYPTDRMAVRLVGLHCITRGDYRGGIDLARRSLQACPDEPQFLTMLGYFLEQSGYNDEGLAASTRALAQDPTNLYAYHAVGHAYQARGDYRRTLETFERAASLERYPHVLWHLAEAQALLGHERITRDYWASTGPPLPLHERIDLLWRLEVVRHAAVDDAVWRDLARQADGLLRHPDVLTTWMHHWLGVAFGRAGEWTKAKAQLERLRRLPDGPASGHWSTLGAALLEGELAVIEGDEARAVRVMASAIAAIDTMGGGSREQKDVFLDVFMELTRRLGHVEEVIGLAQRRLLANPYHLQSLDALVWAYGVRGDAGLRRQACRQLVVRAEAAGVAVHAPELREAHAVLATEA